jgi:hypothetical protein
MANWITALRIAWAVYQAVRAARVAGVTPEQAKRIGDRVGRRAASECKDCARDPLRGNF